MTCDPGRPIAREMSGHAASVRCTRTFARRRRCAHHGTASTSRTDAQDLRKRRRERAEQGGSRQPAGHRGRHHARIDPLGEPGQAEPRTERHEHPRGYNGDAEQVRPPVRVREVGPPARPERRARREDGREFGTVTPRDAGEDHGHRGGELAVGVDDHDRLEPDPAGAASVPAQLAVAGHGRRLVSVAGVPVVPSSARR